LTPMSWPLSCLPPRLTSRPTRLRAWAWGGIQCKPPHRTAPPSHPESRPRQPAGDCWALVTLPYCSSRRGHPL
jgi:hypothetical protein